MANGASIDPEGRFAALNERVDNQGRQIANLESQMKQSFTDLTLQIRGIGDDFRSKSQTPWLLLCSLAGLCITILGGLGFLALQPIKDGFADFKNTYENNRIVSRNDNINTFNELKLTLRETVPRAEHERVWNGIDQRFEDVQRQLNLLQSNASNTYTARDQLLTVTKELEELKRLYYSRPQP